MSALGYDGKVAIITGAGGGLGRQHALMMAKRGALIVVNDLGGSVDGTGANSSAAQVVVDEIKAAGGEAVADHNSVATPEGGAAIVQTAIDTYGRVDIVINNAGILRAFYVTQPAFVHMREQGYGRIISTSSAAGVFGNFGQTNYGAAKMGLVGFTRVLGVEGARFNIKANAIAPLAMTRMTEDILGALKDKLDPGLVSPLVAFLAHEDCPVSGQLFSVGGGRVAHVFLGETNGYYSPTLTPEDVQNNWDTITNRDSFAVPSNLGEETALFLNFFK
jgi:NAD(P)-dependent dehydrogenase (short-subunit alcohol dehydrogenase family)